MELSNFCELKRKEENVQSNTTLTLEEQAKHREQKHSEVAGKCFWERKKTYFGPNPMSAVC